MEIILNGKPCSTGDPCSVSGLLERLQLEGKLAVEINEHIIPRSQFDSHIVSAGDKVEIIHAIGGG
ncbi:MAG: sulfur carrier protein ThiS [Gammaproteobacteria bacterium]